MHKSIRKLVQKARRFEDKVQALSFSTKREAKVENRRMSDNRHWFDRKPKGELRSGSDKANGAVLQVQ